MSRITGIDISKYNEVDWGRLQAAYDSGEISFVIIRAGYGTATGIQQDGSFAASRDEARRRGIPHMFYAYAYPGRASGAVQASAFADMLGQLQNGEGIVLDLEDDTVYGRRLVSSDVSWAKEFLDTAKARLGVKGLLYINSDVLGRFNWTPVKDGDYGLWIANYGIDDGQPHAQPSIAPWTNYALWQYTSKANLAGISPVDANIFFGDKAAFLKYGYQGGAPAPAPTSNKANIRINAGQWFVRTGPGTNYPERSGFALSGQTYAAELQPNGWAKIMFRAAVGFVGPSAFKVV